MIFNLRFRTSFVKLAIKLHPTIEMTLLVFFILNVLTFFILNHILDRDIDIFFIYNLWPRCPAASFCIVSAGSLKLGGRGALRRWNLIKYRQVLFLYENGMNFKIPIVFQKLWVSIFSTHCCLRYLHRALEHTSANDNHEFHLLVASSQRRYYFIN